MSLGTIWSARRPRPHVALALTLVAGVIIGSLYRTLGLYRYAVRVPSVDEPVAAVIEQFRQDLRAATVAIPPADDDQRNAPQPAGYFCYREGPQRHPDRDDRLALTVARFDAVGYQGTVPQGVIAAAELATGSPAPTLAAAANSTRPALISSDRAEVVYWTGAGEYENESGDDGGVSAAVPLYRRLRLIRPELNVSTNRLREAGVAVEVSDDVPPDQPWLGFVGADGIVRPLSMSMLRKEGWRLDLAVTTFADDAILVALRLDELQPPEQRLEPKQAPIANVLLARCIAFDLQRWDSDAPMWITVGPDGQPGTAGVDENLDGIVDRHSEPPHRIDTGELGAVGSDDVVVTRADEGAGTIDPAEAAVIARGTFVHQGDPDARARPEQDAWIVGPGHGSELPGALLVALQYLDHNGEPRQAECVIEW